MLKSFLRRLLVTGAFILIAGSPALVRAAASDVSSALWSVLERHRADYAKGLLAGDAASLSAMSSEQLRLMTEGVPTVFGPANAAAYYRAFLGRFVVRDYLRREIEVRDSGARVIEFGRFGEKLTLKSDGRTFDLNGKYFEAWEKTPDGGLRLVVTAWNYDAWLPDSGAWRFAEVPAVRTALQARAPVDSDVSFELAALNRLIETAIVQHDAKLWSRFYADDAVMLANNDQLHAGRAAIGAYITKHCAELPVFEKLDIRNDRIEEVSGHVFEYASHVAAWRTRDASGVSTGKDLRVWHREPNGGLKIVLQISAYD